MRVWCGRPVPHDRGCRVPRHVHRRGPAAVAADRSAGVPDVRADLASYDDEPFDAVVMLLSLHPMRPLGTVLDRVTRLLRPGGTLILDE